MKTHNSDLPESIGNLRNYYTTHLETSTNEFNLSKEITKLITEFVSSDIDIVIEIKQKVLREIDFWLNQVDYGINFSFNWNIPSHQEQFCRTLHSVFQELKVPSGILRLILQEKKQEIIFENTDIIWNKYQSIYPEDFNTSAIGENKGQEINE